MLVTACIMIALLALIPVPLALKSMAICAELNQREGHDLKALSTGDVEREHRDMQAKIQRAIAEMKQLQTAYQGARNGSGSAMGFAHESMAQAREMMSEPSLRESAELGMFSANMVASLTMNTLADLEFKLERHFNYMQDLADRNNVLEYELNSRKGGLATFIAGYRAAIVYMVGRITGKLPA